MLWEFDLVAVEVAAFFKNMDTESPTLVTPLLHFSLLYIQMLEQNLVSWK